MKDSEIEEMYRNDEELKRFKDDPEWFKKAVAKACVKSREYEESLTHLTDETRALDENYHRTPIFTILKYIRPIVADAYHVYDDEIPCLEEHLNNRSCIILLPSKDGDYIEPVTNAKIRLLNEDGVTNLYRDSNYMNSLTFATDIEGTRIYPFGYVTRDIYEMWKKETLSYKKELIKHISKLQAQTNLNFGISSISAKDIESAVKGIK